MPVICQKCGIEVDDRGSKTEFIACCKDCEWEGESDDDGVDDGNDAEQLHEWPSDEDIYDYYDDGVEWNIGADFRGLNPNNAGMRWSADYEKELWLNGTMPWAWGTNLVREDCKPLWWSEMIDEDPRVRYGEPPIQWDPWS